MSIRSTRNSFKFITSGGLAMALAFFVTGCQQEKMPEGRVVTVRPQTFEVSLNEIGVVEARRVLPIVAPYGGKLIFLPETGKFLEKGDTVMIMEDEEAVEELEDRLNELKSVKSDMEAAIDSLMIAMRSNTLDLDAAESELEYSQIRLEDVTLQMAETEVLLQQSVVPEDDVRTARSDLNRSRLSTMTKDLDFQSQETNSQTQMATNMSRIEQNELKGDRLLREIDQAQDMIKQAKIVAPVSGLFQRTRRWDWRQDKMVEPNEGDDMRRGQVVGEIPDLDTLIVRSQIPEIFFLEVREGSKVNVTFDAYEGFKTQGTVTSVGKVAIDRKASPGGTLVQSNTQSKEKVFEVDIELENPPKDLKPGISAQVSIIISEEENVLAVPIEALDRDGETLYVNVQGANSALTKKLIVPGSQNNTEVVVKSGLQAGDRLFIPDGNL